MISNDLIQVIKNMASLPALADEKDYRKVLNSPGRDDIDDAYASGYLDGKIMMARQLLDMLGRQ
jgi:hypothetical protein